MAGGWNRRTPLLTVDATTLERLLAPHWPDAHVTGAEHVSGGLANTNYRVSLAGRDAPSEPIVVRFYTREPEACAREAALLRLVANRVPVPQALYVEPTTASFDYPYIALSWMDGVPLLDALPMLPAEEAPTLAAALGAVAARIGSFTFQAAGFLDADLTVRERLTIGPEGLRGWLGEMLAGRAGERLGAELTARLLRQIDRCADEAAPLAGQRERGLCGCELRYLREPGLRHRCHRQRAAERRKVDRESLERCDRHRRTAARDRRGPAICRRSVRGLCQ